MYGKNLCHFTFSPTNLITEVVEPVLPAQDGLSAQFAARTVYLLGEIDEERLSPAFWLSAGADDAEQECDQVGVSAGKCGPS